MDEDFRKEPKRSVFDDASSSEPVVAQKESLTSIYEDLPPHPMAVATPETPVIAPEEPKVAQSQRRLRPKKSLALSVVAILIVGMSIGGYSYYKHSQDTKKAAEANNSQQTSPNVSIAIYHAKNLPAGYTYNNDSKTLKADVLYFSISGPNKSLFYITQQPIPANFDFTAFNKKFATPDTFTTASGTVTAGPVGGNMLASIRTNKNTWIIVNSSASATQAQLETVARAFELDN